MSRRVGLILFITSILCIAWLSWFALNADYWLSPPRTKFLNSWAQDVKLMESSGKLPKEWSSVRDVTIKADQSPIQDWLVGLKPPINKENNGKYRLEIFLVHWIEGYRYGVVFQYNLVDLSNQNTIWEGGRTLPLGLYY